MSSTLHQQDMSNKTRFPFIRLEQIPAKLKPYRQFVVWRYEHHGEPKPRKVPYNPLTGLPASVSDPLTWGSLMDALLALQSEPFDGIGFVFTKDDPFVGIDLDKCRDPKTGTLAPWARKIQQQVPSYWEASPSGTGVHGLTEISTSLPPHGRKKGPVEMYQDKRFFTLTGYHVNGTPSEIHECTQTVLMLHADVFGTTTTHTTEQDTPLPTSSNPLPDADLLRRATTAKNGAKFRALWHGDTTGYPSHSEADLALCSHLAFYCGRDPGRINRLFRQSGLYRQKKWNRHDYAQGTIETALRSQKDFHSRVVSQEKDEQEKDDTLSDIAPGFAVVASYPWHGVASNNARIVLCALLQLMKQQGKGEVALCCRDLAEMSGLGFTTAAAALRRLCGIGKDKRDDVPVVLVRIVDKRVTNDEKKPARHAHRYRLKEGAKFAHSSNTGVSGVFECANFAPLLQTVSHDAFRMRGKGLTRSAALVLAALPLSTNQAIAAATHLSKRTIRNALALLKVEGLIEKKEKTLAGRGLARR